MCVNCTWTVPFLLFALKCLEMCRLLAMFRSLAMFLPYLLIQLQMLEQNTEKDKLQLDTNKAEIVRLQEQINLEVYFSVLT